MPNTWLPLSLSLSFFGNAVDVYSLVVQVNARPLIHCKQHDVMKTCDFYFSLAVLAAFILGAANIAYQTKTENTYTFCM